MRRVAQTAPRGLAVLLLVALAGCGERREPLGALPARQAIGLVNANAVRITGTLRASGPVSGSFRTPNGRSRGYDVDGTLFFLAPSNLRLDFKALGGTQMLFGCNATHYWYHNKPDGDFYLSRPHGPVDPQLAEMIPIRPDQIVDALGLSAIPDPEGAELENPVVHRVEAEHQQVLFVRHDALGRASLWKEYWLDRYDPRLVGRVVFRDDNGELEMESRLSDYRRLGEDGPLLPMRIEARWPKVGASMTIRVRRWAMLPQIDAAGPQFTPPHRLGIRYEREDIEE